MIHATIIIASTRAANGVYEDRTGPVLREWLAARGYEVPAAVVVPDGPAVGKAIRAALDAGADFIVTSGGTGITPSDLTPEQTFPFITKELPGVAEAIRRKGCDNTPFAALSRGYAGMAGSTFIVNLPGSSGGVKDGIAVLDTLLDHLWDQRQGGGHE